MAATGGGKIRSRRYHISSKPYAKSRQQPGLISRVTDTVKSIVPSWLQRYFNSGEEGADDTEQNNQPPPLPPPPPNGGEEEGPPPVDGRDSPEPSNTHTEPSTSRASLNFQDGVLSRPPLNRSHQHHHAHHLHFPPLDASSPIMPSSSLFSLPSTSSAAPPGVFSTGFSLVKEIKDNLSQHEDDNISTTSGFSSRASDKDVPTSKTASIPQLWSPETDRTHSGPQQHHHAQSSLKKPSFNLSVFGTSSNASSLNSTVLNSSRLGDSPFYPGKTTYGGASASRSARQPRPSTPYQAPVRRQIKAKPAGAQPCGVTSATAKRILQSLERMSSPLADAKRIPSAASSPLSTSLDGTNLDRSHYQVKRKRLESSPLPPVQKLLIPAAASVSGNRSVSFRPSLTPGGIIALDRTTTPSLTTGGGIIIALDSRTPSLTPALDRTLRDAVRPPSRQSPVIPESDPGPSLSSTTISSGPAYPMSSTPAASSAGSGGGKMKRERTSTRVSSKRPEDEEVMEVLDLPAISLPISTFSLPTFSFSTAPPPPTSSINSSPAPFAARPLTPAAKEPVAEKEPPAASTPPCLPFTFASPIVMATAAASPPSFSPSAGFTFSAPVAKMDLSMSNGQLASPITAAVKSTTSNSTEEEFEGPFKPAKTLKQGSVLDLLKAPGFASPSSSSPVARRSPGPDAAAAPQQTSSTDSKAPSSSSTTSSSAGFGDLFKAPAAGTWDCDVCLVQNKPSDSKCVACTSLRPGSSSSKPADGKPVAAGFAGTLFAAPPAGTWDCDTCLVQNKPEAGKCVACETAKPGTGGTGGVKQPSLTLSSSTFTAGVKTAAFAAPLTGFGDKFKKAEGAWQCDTCMLDNKGLDAKCVACMSPKPGASTAPPSSSAPSAGGGAPLLGFGDKFKKPEGCWDCDVCCVQNKDKDTLCVACQSPKPGATVEPKAFGSSTFGTSGSASGGFKFGSSSSDSTSSGFKFGAAPSDNSSSSSSSSAAAGGGFKFGAAFGGGSSSSSSSETNADSSGSSGFKFGGSGEGFKFGVTAAPNEDKSSEPAAVGSGFKFGAGGGIAFGAGAPVFGLSKPEEKATSSDDTPAASQEKNGDVASSSDASSAAVGIGESDLLTTTATTAPLGGSTFGSLSSEKEPAAPSFTFGNPGEKKDGGGGSAAASAAPSFAFSAAGKEADATPPAPGALGGGFSFGKPDPPKEQPAPAFSFGNPADKSKDPAAPELPKPSFAFGQSATDAAAAAAAPKPAFSFMGTTTTTTATPAPSLFGSTTTTTAAAAPTPSLFGSITTTAAPAPSLFGSTTTTTAAPVPSLFGSSTTTAAPAPSMFGSSTTTAAPAPSMFGSITTTVAAPTPSLFGSITTTTAAPAPSMFGSTTTTTAAAPTPSLFGSITTTAAPAPSMFGTTTTTTAAPVPSLFGSATVSTTAPAPSFVFGQAASSSSSAGDGPPAKGFLFGGSQESQNPAAAAALAAPSASSSLSSTSSQPFVFGAGPAPSFSFGTTAPSAASSSGPSPFVFSPAPSGGFGASQAPSFGSGFESQAPSPFTGGASQTPAFGAKPNATPVFGQLANSTTVFGAAANSTPGGGFAFGGASAFGASSSNSTAGVFAFGGGPAGSAAPTASPSITPQPPAPGGFSFAQPPAFNMGATKSSFTASPAGQQQNISGRKIKTAVRRRK